LDRELALDPFETRPKWFKGITLTELGRYDEAFDLLISVSTETFPDPRVAGWARGICQFYRGKTNDASLLMRDLLVNFPEDSLLTSIQAILSAASGDKTVAKQKIKVAEANERPFVHAHHVAYHIASAYSLIGDVRSAIDSLNRAAEDGFPCYDLFRLDPNLEHLRTKKEFRAFMEQQGKEHEERRPLLRLTPQKAEGRTSGRTSPGSALK
jgi:hypothetical protein